MQQFHLIPVVNFATQAADGNINHHVGLRVKIHIPDLFGPQHAIRDSTRHGGASADSATKTFCVNSIRFAITR